MTRQLLQLSELGLAPVWLRRNVDWQAMSNADDGGHHELTVSAPPSLAANLVAAETGAVQADFIAPQEVVALPSNQPEISRPVRAFANWEALQQEVGACRQCKLCETRTQTVFGKGNRASRLLLIGEAPGAEEDRQGLPFVGKAGQLLDNMLQAIGMDLESCYIANVLKCRPPGNRNPAPDEVLACSDYLQAQIAMIKPDVILALGRFAAHSLLQSEEAIGSLRRRQHDYQGIPLHVTFHPAYLLRSPNEKAKAWQDLLAVKKTLQTGH